MYNYLEFVETNEVEKVKKSLCQIKTTFVVDKPCD